MTLAIDLFNINPLVLYWCNIIIYSTWCYNIYDFGTNIIWYNWFFWSVSDGNDDWVMEVSVRHLM